MALRVLVVDDDADMVESMATVLRLHGYRAKGAHSATDIVACVRDFDPSVVILDLAMPGKSGLDAAREIRASRPGSNRPMLIALTGERRTGLPEGFNYFLRKPCDVNVLLALVGQAR